jgi:hypothetical protein
MPKVCATCNTAAKAAPVGRNAEKTIKNRASENGRPLSSSDYPTTTSGGDDGGGANPSVVRDSGDGDASGDDASQPLDRGVRLTVGRLLL